jgi:predicted Na+-dependent transporter
VLKRFWVLLALLPIMAAGLWAPEPGLWIREQRLLTALLVAIVLFVSGLQVEPRRLVGQARNWRALLLGLGTTYGIAPVVALQLAALLGPPVEGPGSQGYLFLEALMLAAAQSSTLATALTMTRMARGDAELSLVLTLTSNFFAVFFTPLVLAFTLGTVVELPIATMMLRMALVIVLPVAVGQLCARALKRAQIPIPAAVRHVPQGIVLLFVYIGLSAAASRFLEDPTIALQFLLICISLHVVLIGWTSIGSRLAGLKPAERTAVLFGASQKSVPNGIYLWREFFASNPYGAVPIVLHQISQLVIGFLIAPWLGRRHAADSD